MDLWEFFKVLLRRWYLTVPLLAAVLVAAVYAGRSVEPSYTASAEGVFLEPVVTLPVELLAPNPWLQAGVSTTASAVLGSIVNPNAKEQIVAEGYSADYSILMESRTVLFSVFATDETPEGAIATLDHIIQLMRDDLGAKQTQYDVPEDQQILIQMSSGTSIVSTREGLSRILVAVGGLGAVASTALVVGVDALLLRRRRGPEKESRAHRDTELADATG